MSEMQSKTRAKDEDGKIKKSDSTPDKNEIICPLILLVTEGKTGSNYECTWATTIDLGSGPGVWKTATNSRGYSDAFNDKLKALRKAGRIDWDEKAFYFTHEQGINARKKYEQLVLAGKVKANKKSWTNRFAGFTGTSFDELEEKFPELYARKTPTATSSSSEEKPAEEQEEVTTASGVDLMDELDTTEHKGPEFDEIVPPVEDEKSEQPTDVADTAGEPSEEDLEGIEEEQAVSAVSVPELEIEDILSSDDEDDQGDDHKTVRVFADSSLTEVDVTTESIVWQTDGGEQRQAFLVFLPNEDNEMWLEIGEYDINGTHYIVQKED